MLTLEMTRFSSVSQTGMFTGIFRESTGFFPRFPGFFPREKSGEFEGKILCYHLWLLCFSVCGERCLNSAVASEFMGEYMIPYSQKQLNTINLHTCTPYSSVKVSTVLGQRKSQYCCILRKSRQQDQRVK